MRAPGLQPNWAVPSFRTSRLVAVLVVGAMLLAPREAAPYSVLAHDQLRQLGAPELPHWKEALGEYLIERAPLVRPTPL